MTCDDLSPEQLQRLQSVVRRHLHYVMKVVDRMDRLGFPGDDPLYQSAVRARDALQDFYTTATYAGIKSGVGREAK